MESERIAELGRLRAGIKKAARDLYAIEVRRQSLGWHDELTKRLIVVQHNLSALYNEQSDGSMSDDRPHCAVCGHGGTCTHIDEEVSPDDGS